MKLQYGALVVVIAGLATEGCSSATQPIASHVDKIVIVKSAHLMTLMSNGRPIKSYKVALGRSEGVKVFRGDHRTPEGQYFIDAKNAASRFHRALHISYPNASDSLRAHHDGVDPGGAIMIHGVERQFAWVGPLQHDVDWTDGCIAVTNPEIEEVWRLVPVGTPVDIRP
jgi:murein L,D-transpeptidase YafK